jgi:hypothetical protein
MMMWWRNIIAFLIAPLGAPVSFTVWDKLAIEPRSFTELLSSLPGLVRYATPVAYMAALLLGVPAILILSRRKCLTLPVFLIAGTLIGTITGLFIGFHIAGYDISGAVDYFAFDLMAIYAPAVISGMVSSGIYWAILNARIARKRESAEVRK